MGKFNLVGHALNAYIGRYQERLGIAQSMRLAKFYNSIRYGGRQRRAIDAYRNRRDSLFIGNDPDFSGKPRNILEDGWAIDRSGDFPFIEETLAEADRLIEDRGGQDRRGTPLAQTDYLFHLNDVPDLFQYCLMQHFNLSILVVE